MPFRRSGSYSAKIAKSGFFGINAPAVRSSWSSGSLSSNGLTRRVERSSSRSQTPSPHQSPRFVQRKGSVSLIETNACAYNCITDNVYFPMHISIF